MNIARAKRANPLRVLKSDPPYQDAACGSLSLMEEKTVPGATEISNDEPLGEHADSGFTAETVRQQDEQRGTAGVKSVLEALLFVSGEPLSVERLSAVIEGVTRAQLLGLIRSLQADYSAEGRGLQLVEVAGGFQMTTRADCAPWVKRLEKARAGRGDPRRGYGRGSTDTARSARGSHCRSKGRSGSADHVWDDEAIPSSLRTQGSLRVAGSARS
jgi:hypothetical protein